MLAQCVRSVYRWGMETETSTQTSPVPLAPFTLAELNDRGQQAREACGHRCAAVVTESGGHFLDLDLDYLREQATLAAAYLAAASARVAVA